MKLFNSSNLSANKIFIILFFQILILGPSQMLAQKKNSKLLIFREIDVKLSEYRNELRTINSKFFDKQVFSDDERKVIVAEYLLLDPMFDDDFNLFAFKNFEYFSDSQKEKIKIKLANTAYTKDKINFELISLYKMNDFKLKLEIIARESNLKVIEESFYETKLLNHSEVQFLKAYSTLENIVNEEDNNTSIVFLKNLYERISQDKNLSQTELHRSKLGFFNLVLGPILKCTNSRDKLDKFIFLFEDKTIVKPQHLIGNEYKSTGMHFYESVLMYKLKEEKRKSLEYQYLLNDLEAIQKALLENGMFKQGIFKFEK